MPKRININACDCPTCRRRMRLAFEMIVVNQFTDGEMEDIAKSITKDFSPVTITKFINGV